MCEVKSQAESLPMTIRGNVGGIAIGRILCFQADTVTASMSASKWRATAKLPVRFAQAFGSPDKSSTDGSEKTGKDAQYQLSYGRARYVAPLFAHSELVNLLDVVD